MILWSIAFEFASEGNITLRNNFFKLKRPSWNTNTVQKVLSFIDPSFWNQIPETLKKAHYVNTFKDNLKKHFFNQMTWFLLTLPLLLILLFLNVIKSNNIIIIITTVIAIVIILLLLLLVFYYHQYCYEYFFPLLTTTLLLFLLRDHDENKAFCFFCVIPAI